MAEFSTGLPSVNEQRILPAGNLQRFVDRCFKHNRIEDIIEAFKQETENKEWAEKILKTSSSRSPPPAPPRKEMDDFRSVPARASYCYSLYETSGFTEGVKARLLSKPPTQPIWQPDTLEAVTSKDVDFFLTIPEDQTRLPLLSSVDYPAYPHAHYSLPSEAEIKKFVSDNHIHFKETDGQ
jgi:3-hydroxyisobutyryl-CoA hydrolase